MFKEIGYISIGGALLVFGAYGLAPTPSQPRPASGKERHGSLVENAAEPNPMKTSGRTSANHKLDRMPNWTLPGVVGNDAGITPDGVDPTPSSHTPPVSAS